MKFGLNVQRTLKQSLHVSVINFSSFKPDTENNTNFDAVSSNRANSDEMHFLNMYLSS